MFNTNCTAKPVSKHKHYPTRKTNKIPKTDTHKMH